jgi:preprotein translocase subunit SecD
VAPPPGTLRVGRYFLALLALLALLYLIVFFPGKRHTPRLGLDLVGGQQVIFQARAPHGQTPSSSAMSQALDIMRQRVNGTGVTEAQVVQQGADEIVVSIPGGTKTDVAKLGAAAKLNFRGLVAPATAVTCSSGATKSSSTGSPSPSGAASTSPAAPASPAKSTPKAANGLHQRPLTAPTSSPAAKSSAAAKSATGTKTPAGATPSATASGSGSKSAAPAACSLKSVTQLKQKVKLPDPSTVYKSNGIPDSLAPSVQSAITNFDCSTAQTAPDPKNDYYLACDETGTVVYLLGPVIVPGTEISNASAQAPNVANGGPSSWSVSLSLKGGGSSAWAKYTGAHNIGSRNTNGADSSQCSTTGTACPNFVGFTLDGRVVSAPVNESAINGQDTQITGNFSQSDAKDLAQKLKYGALPLTFKAQQAETVSATLGTSQLKAGLLAGGIGLVLVVIYSLVYYRGLGLVTIASLLVSGVLTYGMLVFLGRQIGFTLSLAGIAGFIVAVGITADSFVVFFERIKDEVHEGRSMRVAVPRAWIRARRTVLSADTVSFLAAAILYYFAAGDVKGFAFTLGMSTVLDLVVVFLFTHPMVSLLSRSRAFGSPRFTGLSNARAGGIARNEDDAPVRRPARPARPSGEQPAAAARAAGTTAVREKDEAPEPDGASTAEPSADEPADTPRRHTTPEPGTAAERAAARRRRMREQGDGKGTN